MITSSFYLARHNRPFLDMIPSIIPQGRIFVKSETKSDFFVRIYSDLFDQIEIVKVSVSVNFQFDQLGQPVDEVQDIFAVYGNIYQGKPF